MSLNLIRDRWIPVRAGDGSRARMRPIDLIPEAGRKPVSWKLNGPRPDFNGAVIQFLIGLFQSIVAPEDEEEWWRQWEMPESREYFATRFQCLEVAFESSGSPAFLQDLEELPESGRLPIVELLLDSPAANTKRKNKDLFTKRVEDFSVCEPCAIMAVLTLQLNAPSGGAGHRTSLRGGGPATTILEGKDLWETIWLNLLPRSEEDFLVPGSEERELCRALPWLAPTRTSEGGSGEETRGEVIHRAQCFWAMPRRIRLDPPVESDGECSICGVSATLGITSFRSKNYGVNYQGPFAHPLTPYVWKEERRESALRAGPGGFGYRDWRGFVVSAEEGLICRRPAAVIDYFLKTRSERFIGRSTDEEIQLWAFGFDVENAKIRGWHETRIPLLLRTEGEGTDFYDFAGELVLQAERARKLLLEALERGLYGSVREVDSRGRRCWMIDARVDLEKSLFCQASLQFWRETEEYFYQILRAFVGTIQDDEVRGERKVQWGKYLEERILHLFDQLTGRGELRQGEMKSLALARGELKWFLAAMQREGGDSSKGDVVDG